MELSVTHLELVCWAVLVERVQQAHYKRKDLLETLGLLEEVAVLVVDLYLALALAQELAQEELVLIMAEVDLVGQVDLLHRVVQVLAV
jgi:hypothetical protein